MTIMGNKEMHFRSSGGGGGGLIAFLLIRAAVGECEAPRGEGQKGVVRRGARGELS